MYLFDKIQKNAQIYFFERIFLFIKFINLISLRNTDR
jgi:hypothetical protein